MIDDKKITYVIGLSALNQALSITPFIPQAIYYLIMALGSIYILFKKPKNINFLALVFLIFSILSLTVNDTPEFFSSNQRLIIFIFVSTLVGPLITSKTIFIFRTKIFCILNKAVILLSAFSFITYLLGLTFVRSGTGANSGFFNHSLMLGPFAAVTLLLLIYAKLEIKNVDLHPKIKKYINILLALTALSLIISSSRSSIFGFGLGLIFFLYKKNEKKFFKFLTSFLKIAVVIVLTSPIWYPYTKGIRLKMDFAEESEDIAASRRVLWDARLYEYKLSPLLGIGFASANVENVEAGINLESGKLEPGSSWLAVLAMTGAFGFGTIVLLFLSLFVFLWSDKTHPTKSGVLGAILIFFSFHMTAEGYFLAAGSFLFFYIWLLLGIIYGFKLNKDVKIL